MGEGFIGITVFWYNPQGMTISNNKMITVVDAEEIALEI
jgi:hypothetical protein